MVEISKTLLMVVFLTYHGSIYCYTWGFILDNLGLLAVDLGLVALFNMVPAIIVSKFFIIIEFSDVKRRETQSHHQFFWNFPRITYLSWTVSDSSHVIIIIIINNLAAN